MYVNFQYLIYTLCTYQYCNYKQLQIKQKSIMFVKKIQNIKTMGNREEGGRLNSQTHFTHKSQFIDH